MGPGTRRVMTRLLVVLVLLAIVALSLGIAYVR